MSVGGLEDVNQHSREELSIVNMLCDLRHVCLDWHSLFLPSTFLVFLCGPPQV